VLKSLIHRYAIAVVHHRWIVLAFAVLATAILASRIGALQLNNDPDLWSPRSHEFTKTTQALTRIFGGRNVTIIGVVPKQGDVYNPRVLQKIRNIQAGIEALPEAIKHNVVSLAARRVKDIQGSADGMVVREMLQTLPQTQPEIEQLKKAIARNPVYIGSLVSADGKAAAVIADFRVTGESAAYLPLYQKILEVVDKEREADVEIRLGGQPVHAANFELAMQKMPLYFGVAFLIILSVQFLAFRSVQGMVLPMVTALLAVVWGLGVMAIAGIQMDALNTTTPILIMAVATGHAVQILKRYYEELATIMASGTITDMREANRAAVSASLLHVGPVMLTAGLIAAIAFFSLALSDVPMIRNFGIFAGSGVLAAIVIEFTLIPALRSVLPARPKQGAARRDMLDGLLAWTGGLLTVPSTARVILAIAAVVVAAVSCGAVRIASDNSFKQYFPEHGAVRQDDAVLNAKFGGTDSIVFLVQGDGPDAIKDARVLQGMSKLQAFLETQPHVGKTQSIADLIKRMNQAMHNDDQGHYAIPSSSNLISQYLLLYSLTGDPQDFDNLVDTNYQQAVIWTYLKTDSTSYSAALYEKCKTMIAAEFPTGVTVRIGGSIPQTIAANDGLVSTKVTNILQMAIVVFVLASLALRSLVGGVLVVIPLAVIVLMNLGLMGWLGTPLDMGTASITAMVTGIGADYEIYMLCRLREEFARHRELNRALQASLLTSGKAVLFVALSIAGGYAALLISDFQFYPRLGATMIMTMAISALLSLLFLRAVVAVFQPRFIVGVAPAAPNDFAFLDQPKERST
jgi:predicted RND superfamily exporter protein